MVRKASAALLLLAFCAVTFAGCGKPGSAATSTPTPGPTPEVVVASLHKVAPTKPPPRLTPEGVVYLTKRISVTTDSSVIGIPEGTRVDIVERKGGRIAGQIEGMVLELTEDEVTNNIDQIEAILKKRAETEAALAKKVDPLEAAGIHLPEPKPPRWQNGARRGWRS